MVGDGLAADRASAWVVTMGVGCTAHLSKQGDGLASLLKAGIVG